jgi:AraC-like DNA-binding protein
MTFGSEALKEILPNLQVHLIEAHYTECWPEWREIDYTPAHNKLYFILEGEGWLRIGGREFRPRPGQLCLMPAHVKQSYSVIEGRRPFLKYWCHFTATVGPLDLFQWLETPFVLDVSDRLGDVVRLFEELTTAYRDGSLAARFQEKSSLLALIAVLADNAAVKFGSRQREDAARLERIKQYVEEHLHEAVTLEDLARHVYLHPNYLIKYFNKHFGVSPLKYIGRKRMEKARFLLRSTGLSIKEIAQLTGFGDMNHFSKAFRRETSFSPSAYRSNMLLSMH